MTVNVHPPHAGPGGDQGISPELVLVDPALAATARALLPEPGALVPRDPGRVAVPLRPIRPRASAPAARWDTSRRVLVAVAGVTMVVLLLFDVRVEVGQRQASAEPQASGVAPTTPPIQRPRTAGARPGAQKSSKPTERKFAWAPVAGATGYHVEFFRGHSRVFTQDTTEPDITVPARWTYQGNTRSFRAGEYRWYVWPVVAGLRQSRAAVQASLTIQAD
jgi:hypothetical protein